jgi:hypothetical protein
MVLFLALVLNMGHDQHNRLIQYWSRKSMCMLPSLSMSCSVIGLLLHILLFLHFENKMLPARIENVMTDQSVRGTKRR